MKAKNSLLAFITVSICFSLVLFSFASAKSEFSYDLPTPTKLKAKAFSSSQIDLSWNYKPGNYIFKIYRAASPNGQFKVIDKTSKTSFSDAGLKADKTYYYKVQAAKKNNAKKVSQLSNVVHARTLKIDTNTTINKCTLNGKDIELCLQETNLSGSLSANILSSSTKNNYAVLDIDNSLVGWWRMEDINSSAVKDSSKYGNDGTTSIYLSNEGKFGQGYDVSSSYNNGINIGYFSGHSSLYLLDSLTISTWVNFDNIRNEYAEYPIISSGFTNRYPSDFVMLNVPYYLSLKGNSQIRFAQAQDGSYGSKAIIDTNIQIPTEVQAGGWHNIIVTVSKIDETNREARFYIDEQLIDTKLYTGNPTGTPDGRIDLGYKNHGGQVFSGTIDELLLFSRALSPTEIKSLYDAKANPLQTTFTLPAGNHTLQAHVVDADGNLYSTPVKTISVA